MSLPIHKLDNLVNEYEELEVKLSGLSSSDPEAFVRESKRYKEMGQIVSRYRELLTLQEDISAAEELLGAADESDKESLNAEIISNKERIKDLEAAVQELLVPADPDDSRNAIVEIRGAEGGEEANLFAKDLFKMYQSYAARKSWTMEIMSEQDSPHGGYDGVTFILKGENVWRHMKHEGGPHRVQRVPETESQGRIHTSSATVSVLPEADEVEVEIKDSDLETDIYRSSGPGGQSVNTTDSAVRITHKPTGLVVTIQDEKSQLQNKNKAMKVLRARLYDMERQRQEEERSSQKKGQLKGGGRSEKVRTYNFKDNRVTDHRVGLTLHKLDRFLTGEMDEIIDACIQQEREAIQEEQE